MLSKFKKEEHYALEANEALASVSKEMGKRLQDKGLFDLAERYYKEAIGYAMKCVRLAQKIKEREKNDDCLKSGDDSSRSRELDIVSETNPLECEVLDHSSEARRLLESLQDNRKGE
jgi:hypothetical protein